MRETLADPTLARYAGRFVWLELDFDKPENQAFIARHEVTFTPSFFVLNPADERAAATHLGGMTLPELNQFLDQGERGVKGTAKAPADAALARGDAMVGRGRAAGAAAAYREALRLAAPGWPERPHAVRSLTWVLMNGRESQACAEMAAAEAPGMPRGPAFASIVLSGLSCDNQGGAASWVEATRKTLEPLAVEAIALPTALRDTRFQLLQQLMVTAQLRGDTATLAKWGGRWLDEIESTTPAGDDERTALDIARVDAVSLLGTPERALPALAASERAMPNNYSASLRFAQMATEAKRYGDALAACERGLAHVTGPIGRTWLLATKADALTGKGESATARRVLEEALQSARAIGNKRARDRNVQSLTQAIAEIDNKAK